MSISLKSCSVGPLAADATVEKKPPSGGLDNKSKPNVVKNLERPSPCGL